MDEEQLPPLDETIMNTVTEIEVLSRRLQDLVPFYRDKVFLLGPGERRLAWVGAHEERDRCERIRVLDVVIAGEQRYLTELQTCVKAAELQQKFVGHKPTTYD